MDWARYKTNCLNRKVPRTRVLWKDLEHPHWLYGEEGEVGRVKVRAELSGTVSSAPEPYLGDDSPLEVLVLSACVGLSVVL